MAEANGETRNAAVFPTSSVQQEVYLLREHYEEKGYNFQTEGRNSKSQATKKDGNSDLPTVPSAMVH